MTEFQDRWTFLFAYYLNDFLRLQVGHVGGVSPHNPQDPVPVAVLGGALEGGGCIAARPGAAVNLDRGVLTY